MNKTSGGFDYDPDASRLERIMEEVETEIFALDGVVGMGIGKGNILTIYVRDIDNIDHIPRDVRGESVDIVEVGEIKAQEIE